VSTALIPAPGTDLVPDGWCDSTVVPWLAEQTDLSRLPEAQAALAGLEAAYKTMGADAFEIEKSLVELRIRRGEILGKGKRGKPTKDVIAANGRNNKPKAASDRDSEDRRLEQNKKAIRAAMGDPEVRMARSAKGLLAAAKMRVHGSSDTPEWSTPQDLFDALDAEFKFTLDVCATPGLEKCKRFFSPEQDGLSQKWKGSCFMNPPYGSEIGDWVAKAAASADESATVVCLVPARVDTAWWWDYCSFAEVRFLRGRLRFGGASAGAPFPSAVVIFGRPIKTVYWDWR
jgi:phage N-6-adenine-methyltransferase